MDVFHHALQIFGIQNAEMQRKVFLLRHHFDTLLALMLIYESEKFTFVAHLLFCRYQVEEKST